MFVRQRDLLYNGEQNAVWFSQKPLNKFAMDKFGKDKFGIR